jgi:hypothetical protein
MLLWKNGRKSLITKDLFDPKKKNLKQANRGSIPGFHGKYLNNGEKQRKTDKFTDFIRFIGAFFGVVVRLRCT